MSDSPSTSKQFDAVDQDEYIRHLFHAIDVGNNEVAKTAVKEIVSNCWYMLSLTYEMKTRIEYLENEVLEASASTVQPWDPYDKEDGRAVHDFVKEFDDKIASKIAENRRERLEMYKRAIENSVCEPPAYIIESINSMKV